MTSGFDPTLNALDRIFRGWEPEIDDGDPPISLFAVLQKPDKRSTGQSAFQTKAHILIDELAHSLEHHATCCECCGTYVVWRDATGKFVGIQKLANLGKLRQELPRGGSFASAVGTREDHDLFHGDP